MKKCRNWGGCLISCSPMPGTSFVVSYSQHYLPSDESKLDSTSSCPSRVAGSFSRVLSILAPPPRGSERAGGLPSEACGRGCREGLGRTTWPLGGSVVTLEGGLWTLSLAARNASCFPHISQVNQNEVTFVRFFFPLKRERIRTLFDTYFPSYCES